MSTPKTEEKKEEAGYKVPTIESVVYPKLVASLPSLEGLVVVITGTTSGTGYIAAATAAQKGARVVLLNRPSDRATSSLAKLQKEYPKAEFTAVPCNLQSFESVRAAAATINTQFAKEGVNCLINNAGVMAMLDKRTGDGYDVQMQTNHLSHFLLTKEIFPALQRAGERTGDARVVNHSSLAAKGEAPLAEEYFQICKEGTLGGDGDPADFETGQWFRYHQSKLANQVFTHAFNDRIGKDGKVRAFVAHPGLAATQLQATTTSAGGWDSSQAQGFMKNAQSPEDGACGILVSAFQKDLKGTYYGPQGWGGEPVSLDLEPNFDAKEGKDLLWAASVAAVGGDMF